MGEGRALRCLLLDWGDTVMRVFPQFSGAMHTWPHVEPMPGTAEVLTSLRGGLLMALVTNAGDSDGPAIWKALHRVRSPSLSRSHEIRRRNRGAPT